MTKFYWVLGAVAVLGVGAVGYSVGSQALGSAATEPIEIEGLDDMERLVELAQGITTGDPDAPITIVEFADYQCPGCAQFATSIKPLVLQAYVKTGQAKFVYYDLPLTSIHRNSFVAARAGRCADDQGKFWAYQDEVFRNQTRWAVKENILGDLEDFAGEVGLDEDQFAACLNSDAHADVVSANQRLAYELGLNATPTILISRGRGMARRLGGFGFGDIQPVMDDLIAEIEAEAAETGGD